MKGGVNLIAERKHPQRLEHVDSLRGFALFGILLVNMLAFQYGMYGFKTLSPGTADTGDGAGLLLIEWLFQGSFYPVFSILFGFGGALMFMSAAKAGKPFYSIYARRLLILLFIGAAHLYLLWDGDILLTYALTGFVFTAFLAAQAKTILIWIVSLALFIILPALGGDPGMNEAKLFADYIEAEQHILAEGTYREVLDLRISGDPYEKAGISQLAAISSFIFMLGQILFLFLIGCYIAKKEWMHNLQTYRNIWQTIFWTALPAGLLLKGMMVFTAGWDYAGYMIGGPLLGLGWIAAFNLNYFRFTRTGLNRGLAAVGKTALTNYLGQSFVMTSVFYGYGLGLFGNLGILPGILLVAVLFIMQMIISTHWLNYFTLGPMEWLWRSGTYMRIVPIRRQ
ncbi:uncharacterized protein BCL52_2452 [Salisediminibacterium halotolerans]|nr:uncharacterized protein BCL39_2457 [Actinophytocola xinjiangensis]RPE86934.1 uncharacterized protein EDD67_1798 [Salisediminibacterium halotolerans]TWG32997.1 uncharacterized protein BCL52_2452 [Salisediminibacterium halotolerans]GEL09257.1 hypothetical protein SHA02_26730 [Salisediminibacterium halotolerans]